MGLSGKGNVLGIAPEGVFRFDPVVVSAAEDVHPLGHLLEQVASVEVAVGVS